MAIRPLTARATAHLHTGHDGIVCLAGVHCLLNQELKILSSTAAMGKEGSGQLCRWVTSGLRQGHACQNTHSSETNCYWCRKQVIEAVTLTVNIATAACPCLCQCLCLWCASRW